MILIYQLLLFLYIVGVYYTYGVFKAQENIKGTKEKIFYLILSMTSCYVALPCYYILKHYFYKKRKDDTRN